jgi:hypothetical protein
MIRCGQLSIVVVLFAVLPAVAAEAGPSQGSCELLARFRTDEARQGVAVDAGAFYAVDNTTIAKFDKKTGALVAKWAGEMHGSIVHLNSASVVDGKIYAAHSNYPARPMTSSIEIWDAAALKHLESHSLGTERGWLAWLDRDAKGVWWGAFANYNRGSDRSSLAYGSRYTQVVRFDADWRVAETWVFPDALVNEFGDMSNSGGSWGPDGKLYVTGHDKAKLYVVEPPKIGAQLKWIGTLSAEISGQGIAFDHSRPGVIYGIIRKKEGNDVTVCRANLPVAN